MVELKDIIAHIETSFPLSLQEEWDNSGLQVGFLNQGITKILVCLDITEAIVDEAISKGCNLIVSHHPLLFKGLKQVSDITYQQRVVVKALNAGIAIYSAHTNCDNAYNGVNYRIASKIGLRDCKALVGLEGGPNGSGLIGELTESVPYSEFLSLLKEKFGVTCLRYSDSKHSDIKRVALCGGAGAFLLPKAIASGADCFISGEFHYHDYFENSGVLLAELGHYQSEKFTIELIAELLTGLGIEVIKTENDTNPINYL